MSSFASRIGLQWAAAWLVMTDTYHASQRLQNPLIKEYTLNLIRVPIIIYGIIP